MEQAPLVSVLMPVYNGEEYLNIAIDSILNQTFTNFEFLIINDGSTDNTDNIILSYTDQRIRYIKNEQNLKLIATLNKGILLAKGKYIARMDADDISLPQRLEKQINFLENNPQIGLCGTFMKTLGNTKDYTIGYEVNSDNIKFRLLFDTHFPHPAAVLRKSVLQEFKLEYEAEFIHVEDYVLWNRMAEHTELAIIPEVLVIKREHENQISVVHLQTQQQIMGSFRKVLTEKITGAIDDNTYKLYSQLLKAEYPTNANDAIKLIELLDKIIRNNRKLRIYNPAILDAYFTKLAHSIMYNSTGLGNKILSAYKKTVLSKSNISLQLIVKYFLKIKPKYQLIVKTV
jgi:glycosyltransferase involved in cell wall biosynthesis